MPPKRKAVAPPPPTSIRRYRRRASSPSSSSGDDSILWDLPSSSSSSSGGSESDDGAQDNGKAGKRHRPEDDWESQLLMADGEIVPLSRQHTLRGVHAPTESEECSGVLVVMPDVERLHSSTSNGGFRKGSSSSTAADLARYEGDLEDEAAAKLNEALRRSDLYSHFLRDRVAELVDDDSASFLGLDKRRDQKLTLMDHQVYGARWLTALYENGVSGILADEMGLGKTIQAIVFLGKLIREGQLGPHIIVAPLSTLDNWAREIAKWLPAVPVVVFHGDESARADLRRKIRTRCKPSTSSEKGWEHAIKKTGGIILTTYEIATREVKFLANLEGIGVLLVDEAHRLKNYRCRLVVALQQIHCEGRYILTGTPVQNSLAELWSILHFIAPDVFAELSHFRLWFEESHAAAGAVDAGALLAAGTAPLQAAPSHTHRQAAAIVRMHRVLKPFMLRRTKESANLHLPPLIQLVVKCPLTPLQRSVYRDLVAGTLTKGGRRDAEPAAAAGAGAPPKRPKGRHGAAHISRLRLACCHPFLLEGVDPYRNAIAANNFCPRWPDNPALQASYCEDVVNASSKLQNLHRLLPRLIEAGHRILIFSQFTLVLDILEEYLNMPTMTLENDEPRYPYVRLDGEANAAARAQSINDFNAPQSPLKLFLLSTRAGGVGLNLCSADTVILFDGDFNPHNDIQAISRCHRIGQTKPVVAYRLVAPATVEDTVLRFGISKLRMERLVVGCGSFGGGFAESNLNLSDDEMATALIKEEDNARTSVAEALAAESVTIGDAFVDAQVDCFTDSVVAALVDRNALVAAYASPATSPASPAAGGVTANRTDRAFENLTGI